MGPHGSTWRRPEWVHMEEESMWIHSGPPTSAWSPGSGSRESKGKPQHVVCYGAGEGTRPLELEEGRESEELKSAYLLAGLLFGGALMEFSRRKPGGIKG